MKYGHVLSVLSENIMRVKMHPEENYIEGGFSYEYDGRERFQSC